MRTTLKRGIGRGAAVNGNGRAVLPPGVLTPVTHYRQPEPTRSIWGSLARIFLLTVAISSIAVFGAAGGVYLEALAAVDDLAPKEQVKLALDQLDIAPANAPANALVIGYDHRPEDGTAPSRSDTVMLLRADPQGDTISMLSFPRDLIVEVRCPNGGRSLARINAAYSFCGVEGTVETVKGLTGLPIHYIITVNFDGFRKVVDRLNGVWIDVDRRYFNNNKDGGENYAEINLWPGYQRLKGWQALDYVRFRHTDSDLYRVARQQAFVKAVKQAVNASYKPRSVPKIVGAMRKNVEVGQASGEVSVSTLASYALFVYGLESGHFHQVKIGGLTGANELSTDPSNIRAAVTEFVKPDVDAAEKATAVALRRRARLKGGLSPRNVSVVALNGNGVPGAAANASYQLGQRGYRVHRAAGGSLGERAEARLQNPGVLHVQAGRPAGGGPGREPLRLRRREAVADPEPSDRHPGERGDGHRRAGADLQGHPGAGPRSTALLRAESRRSGWRHPRPCPSCARPRSRSRASRCRCRR